MSNSMPKKGSHGWTALSHMWRAEAKARTGNRLAYETHIKKAHVHVGNHVKALTVDGKHDEAVSFNTAAQRYLKHIDSLIKESEEKVAANRAEDAAAASERKQSGGGGFGKSERLKKSFNPNYDYKHYHDLSAEDRVRAAHAFNERDMESHYYPVDRDSGELAHAPRFTADMLRRRGVSVSAPKSKVAPAKLIPANQRVGARVRVNSPDHPHHGRSGIVQIPHPSMMDKVNVRVSTKEGRFESAYLSPHQVELQASDTVKKSNSSGSQKAKWAFSKVETALRVMKGKRRK